jgi:metallo-beta-lactamase family protein
MKIAFHGAARTVTGSKHLLTLNNGTNILLDCGMFQGMGDKTQDLNERFGFNPEKVDFVLLSHAHIDHSGLLPKLVREGFKGRIFCTPATKDLAVILLENSASIQQHDNGHEHHSNIYTGKKEETTDDTFYDQDDVDKTIELMETVAYNYWQRIQDGVEVCFTDAGHIIGSAAVHLKIEEDGKTTHLTFSGDVGRYRDAILCPPATFQQADYIILESTYGDKLHDPLFNSTDFLMKVIKHTCVHKGGKLIIPAFSIGRTQELLYFLNQLSLEKRLPDIKIVVDSPLGHAATKIIKSHKENFNDRIQKILEIDDDPFDFPGLYFIDETEDSIKLQTLKEPMIIIAASGMADAGRIRHHIKNNVEDAQNTILLVGYCDPESLGGKLMNGARRVHILGEDYAVNAEVEVMHSMSAHGDYNDLLKFVGCQESDKVQKVFLVHGEYATQQTFKDKLLLKGFEQVHIPAHHEVVELEEVLQPAE